MINSRGTTCFPNASQGLPVYGDVGEDIVSSSSLDATFGADRSSSLLYNLSVLKEKVHHVQSLVGVIVSTDQRHPSDHSTAMAAVSIANLLQEIMVTASSMIFTCQHMSFGSIPATTPLDSSQNQPIKPPESSAFSQPRDQGFYSGETLDWYGESYNTCDTHDNNNHNSRLDSTNTEVERRDLTETIQTYEDSDDIIELDAEALLAKYTHYCHVCGKGFKRDANLRMHMRAHGDKYKSSSALSKPTKNNGVAEGNDDGGVKSASKYSCPQEGCRWNRKHAKFQPLKSMICVKNHYKRSHCPKMYVCKRCSRKQFSVLSDLRTHEKHCGDLRWRCSCGTTFSRKDKLMGHVGLFAGHSPVTGSLGRIGKVGTKQSAANGSRQ